MVSWSLFLITLAITALVISSYSLYEYNQCGGCDDRQFERFLKISVAVSSAIIGLFLIKWLYSFTKSQQRQQAVIVRGGNPFTPPTRYAARM